MAFLAECIRGTFIGVRAEPKRPISIQPSPRVLAEIEKQQQREGLRGAAAQLTANEAATRAAARGASARVETPGAARRAGRPISRIAGGMILLSSHLKFPGVYTRVLTRRLAPWIGLVRAPIGALFCGLLPAVEVEAFPTRARKMSLYVHTVYRYSTFCAVESRHGASPRKWARCAHRANFQGQFLPRQRELDRHAFRIEYRTK